MDGAVVVSAVKGMALRGGVWPALTSAERAGAMFVGWNEGMALLVEPRNG
jgi:hypothetical protein